MADTGASAQKIWDSIVNVIMQLYATIPDSILFGSIILYIVTLSKAYGVFALFIIELIASHKFLSWLIKGTVGPSSGPQNTQCASGYKLARLNYTQIMPTHQYPSYGIFSIAAIATYLGLSTYEFYDVMESKGPQWKYRAAIAGVFIIAILLLCIIVLFTVPLSIVTCFEKRLLLPIETPIFSLSKKFMLSPTSPIIQCGPI